MPENEKPTNPKTEVIWNIDLCQIEGCNSKSIFFIMHNMGLCPTHEWMFNHGLCLGEWK